MISICESVAYQQKIAEMPERLDQVIHVENQTRSY